MVMECVGRRNYVEVCDVYFQWSWGMCVGRGRYEWGVWCVFNGYEVYVWGKRRYTLGHVVNIFNGHGVCVWGGRGYMLGCLLCIFNDHGVCVWGGEGTMAGMCGEYFQWTLSILSIHVGRGRYMLGCVVSIFNGHEVCVWGGEGTCSGVWCVCSMVMECGGSGRYMFGCVVCI